jgi:membrane protease YdiL (CAAX protease family)
MINRFLKNAYNGENKWWKYLITIILSLIASNIVALIFLLFLLIFYSIFVNVGDVDSIVNFLDSYDSNIIVFLLETFVLASFSLAYFFLAIKFIHKKDIMSLINFSAKFDEFSGKPIKWINRIKWLKILKGTLIWFCFLSIVLIISYILNPNGYYINFNIDNFYLILLLLALAIPIQVFFEEIFFRGYLNQAFYLVIKRPIIVIFLSSFIFGLGHIFNNGMDPISMIVNVSYTFILGIIFSVATLANNGIEWATGAHLGNNLFILLINSSEESLGNFPTIIQSTGVNTHIEAIVLLISFLVFCLFMFIYKHKKIFKGLDIN